MQTRQHLHQGPIHIPQGGSPAVWEFAIEIPRHPSPRAVVSEMKNPEASYLPVAAESIASCPLPSSFATSGRHGNTRFEGYVEYHLEASLQQQGSGSRGRFEGTTATLPVRICAPPMPYPLSDFDLARRSAGLAARSYRLVPGMESAELTFKQKSKKFFGSSKVPTFGFTLQYDSPGVLQLGNPTPVPFRVRVVPEKNRTSEVLHGVPQVVTLSSLELMLKADTRVIAPGTWGTHTGDAVVKHNVQLPVAFAGSVPASVLRTMDRGAKGKEAAGKQPDQGVVTNETGARDEKRPLQARAPREDSEEAGQSSTPQANDQPAQISKEEQVDTAAGPSCETTSPKLEEEEPTAESSSPPSYQPRKTTEPPPPPPPPAASEMPPAYQLPRDLSSRGPLVIPSAWVADGPWLDVGAATGLRLHETHVMAMGRAVAGTVSDPICPDFTTYCIRHSHRLKWKMTVAVGGETVSLEGERPVSVFGPAESG
ncbi:hypothetical protein diail_7946 [Diaporthe ilicicola]|nr:hypothetical protein diail_7946 [Diaporthe ilicicola]